jgi:DNA-binding NtrC family response regulator
MLSAQTTVDSRRDPPPTAIIADSDLSFCESLRSNLVQDGLPAVTVNSSRALRAALGKFPAAIAIVGEFGDGTEAALRVLTTVLQMQHNRPVIFSPWHSSEETILAALRAGTTDYLRRPVSAAELAVSISRCGASFPTAVHRTDSASSTPALICASEAMRSIRDFIVKASRTDSTVLITGETGTGKEVLAQLIHDSSPRRAQPLVSINCASLPDTLLESELFGYERGAFTGAASAFPGRLRLARGGTVVLDEIGEMSSAGQAKLLRAIDSRQISPLGSRHSVPIDVRIVAATNQDPERLVREQRFRSDLYFRLNVVRVHVSPLRERRDDVLPLFRHYLAEFCGRSAGELLISQSACECLLRYQWPGNVRELRNVAEVIGVDPPPGEIAVQHLPSALRQDCATAVRALSERDRMVAVLSATQWNKSRAARQLNWSRMTLYRKMMKYDIAHNPSGMSEPHAL